MEEKKVIKIKLSTLIISIIFILLLLALVGFIIYLSAENAELKNIATSSEDKRKDLENALEKKFGKDFVMAGFSFDDLDDLKDDALYDNTAVQDFSIDEIKEAINNYLTIFDLYHNSSEDLLLKLGLSTRRKLRSYSEADEVEIDGDYYYTTDISFDDYKDKMLQYMTLECFKENFCDNVKSLNGKLYYSYYNFLNFDPHNIEEIRQSNNETNTFYVKFKNANDNTNDSDYYNTYYNTYTMPDDEVYFTITSRNSKPVIDDTDLF